MPGVNGWAKPSGLPLATVGGIAYKMISSMSGWPSRRPKNGPFFPIPLIDAPFQENYCKRALPLVIFVGVFFLEDKSSS